jgi:nucleoside-diphosphate-sugar epimerase
MRTLLPGGGGYIGAVLVPYLLSVGHKVTVYDRFWFGKSYLPEDNPNLRIIKEDVRNFGLMSMACHEQDAVIMLGSISAEHMCVAHPDLARTVNEEGAAVAARAAAAMKVKRFIYASSVAAYGSMDRDAVETDELRPTTIYGKGKAAAEEAVRAEFPEATIVRCASVCGYSPRMRFDLTVNMMVHDAVKRGVIVVNGGEQKRCHVHIQDVCRFYQLLLYLPTSHTAGETFNVVGQNQTVMQTAVAVSQALGASAPIEIHGRSDDRSYTVDGKKARDLLCFEAKKTVSDAAASIKAFFDAGYWKDTSEPHFKNVAHGLV